MDIRPEQRLPESLQKAASVWGNEWGWHPDLVPTVVREAEKVGLLNLGGQLQFRLLGRICECYWVNVYPEFDDTMPWDLKIRRAATSTIQGFEDLSVKFDFIEEGRKAFPKLLKEYEQSGGRLTEVMFFILYFDDEKTSVQNAERGIFASLKRWFSRF